MRVRIKVCQVIRAVELHMGEGDEDAKLRRATLNRLVLEILRA